MISVYDLKSKFQNLLRPVCNKMAALDITANHVTISTLILNLLYAFLLSLNIQVLWLLLPAFLFIRMALNAIDGMLAREHNMKSKLGMALNELGDVIADTALFIPFILIAPQSFWYVFAFIMMAILTEFCGFLTFMMSGARQYQGPMGKSDRAALTGILGFLIGLGINIPAYFPLIFGLAALLCAWSCLNRIQSALKN